MADSRTLGDLYKTKNLTEDALAAAIAAAVAASPWATEVLGREDATEPQKRAAVRTAMLLAKAERAATADRS